MAVTASRVTVATAAVALNPPSTSGLCLEIKNGAAIVALGASNVTTGAGYELAAAGTVRIDLDPGDVLFAICATSSIVQVLTT